LSRRRIRWRAKAADVIEDVHRMGGWGVVAHPDSPKPELRWRQWNVPYDGVEWLNADFRMARRVDTETPRDIRPLPGTSRESIASLFAHPAMTLRRWDMAMRNRPVVALAALDAQRTHRLGSRRGAETPDARRPPDL